MHNRDIAELFYRMGTLLEIQGENVFKVKAYYKAADNIKALAEDIAVLKNEDRLSEIPGIGKALQEKIIEYLDLGRVSAYEKLIKEVPETLLEIVNIPTIGPKKAKLFYDLLKIKNLSELKAAALDGSLLKLPAIREKTIENILRGLNVVAKGQERINLGSATQIATGIIDGLKKIPEVLKISSAGSLRRGSETIGDIDILVASKDPKSVMESFIHLPQVTSVLAHGETKSSIVTKENIQIDLRVVSLIEFGAALLYFTGSKNFNVKIRQIAMKQSKKVNEYGVFLVKDDKEKLLAARTEEDCFKALELPYIPPELREDIGEKELFEGKGIPKLIELSDIRGEFHVHSTYSDGHHSIEQMALAAQKKGYQYLAISDHSVSLRVARGVSVEDLKKKKEEIEKLNHKMKDFRVLFGTEVEIDRDGNLDYNEKILSEFDVVIAAIHSGFKDTESVLTNRLLKAVENKYVHMIAHPTGVHLGKREAYAFDFKEVCRAAVDQGVCLEINSFPVRLDLNSANVYFAKKMGVKFVINTDAHHIDHLEFMPFGISIARRGWLSKEDVVNTLPLVNMQKILKKNR